MRSFYYIFTAIACMVLISVATALLAVGQIERLARSSVREALSSDGMGWVEVRVDGLQVILSGTAPDEAARHLAQRLAGTAVNTALVIDEMDVVPASSDVPTQYSVEFLSSDGQISVIGVVPSSLDRDEMAAAIARLTNGGVVRDLLDHGDYPVPPAWMEAFEFSLETLGRLPWSRIAVQADRVEVKAISESQIDKGRFEAELRQRVPDGVDLVLDISAPRPVIAPFTLRFLVDANGGRFDACSARSESGRKRILSAAAQAGLMGNATCRIGLGSPSPSWPDAVVAGITAVERLGAGSVTFSDLRVSLVAPAETEQVVFERVIEELDAALPEIFSLTAIKSDPRIAASSGETESNALPEFAATVSPEGSLLLRGRITDETLRDTVEGLARALFPSVSVQAALRLDAGLPQGWAKKVFAGLESLSLLAEGSLLIQSEFIDIRGIAHDPGASDEISRILSAGLGVAEEFAIQVNYVEPESTESSLPSPEECVAGINAILDSQQIGFEPGSSEIGHRSFSVIDRLAEVMEGCSDVRMEIGGHTDSQGREEMNLRLSQGRAEAVLTALQMRRVLTGNLTPVGYGETRPIADNGTKEGREANRRIEFTLVADGDEAGGTGEETGEENEQN